MNVTADLVAEVVERAIPHIAFDLRPDVLAAMERTAAAEEDPRGKLVLEQLPRAPVPGHGHHLGVPGAGRR